MIISIKDLNEEYLSAAGDKAFNLYKLGSLGYSVPGGVVLTSIVYKRFILETGLLERIKLELSRRDINNMRWEELWDASLRIRNMFSKTKLPENLYRELEQHLNVYNKIPVAVRSSAPGEDSMTSSFAGLHESFLNVLGVDSIIEHVKLVWASLWSDKALMYRNELGLDIYSSSMAVIVQEMVAGEVSGVAFSINPSGGDEVVIEVVSGLNQSLVDGEIDPERWILNRKTGEVVGYHKGEDNLYTDYDVNKKFFQNILDKKNLDSIFNTVIELHRTYGISVDVEWTIKNGVLFLLQVRPVTTVNESDDKKPWEKGDKRPWYRSLSKSFVSLRKLQRRIEEKILPGMAEVASTIRGVDLESLSPRLLATEIEKRNSIYKKWKDIYWEELIPFAHGVRLFGQLYNDTVKPSDPYEFTKLLSSKEMLSTKRNKLFAMLIEMLRSDSNLCASTQDKNFENLNSEFKNKFSEFVKIYGDAMYEGLPIFKKCEKLLELLFKIANSDYVYKPSKEDPDKEYLEKNFLSFFSEEQQGFVSKSLELARVSWKLRDDDNIYLAKIEVALSEAVDAGIHRLEKNHKSPIGIKAPEKIAAMLRGEVIVAVSSMDGEHDEPIEKDMSNKIIVKDLKTKDGEYTMKVRKYTGQPASPGIGVGTSRIIKSPDDIFSFQEGEVLVCDSIDPNMTFIVPFASAIIERRGGMLIHGAIIAREYGIPCVTGIENATQLIKTGSTVTVDGYLGIVTIREG